MKLTKCCLRKLLQNAQLIYEELETVLIEIENVLNSRPLTYVYEDSNEPPWTPSTLVTGRRLLEQSAVSENFDNSGAVTLGKRARLLELLISGSCSVVTQGVLKERFKGETLCMFLRTGPHVRNGRWERLSACYLAEMDLFVQLS